jgi:hypothetical protein
MTKVFYFLMVSLFFTTFQVLEVEAQRGDSRGDGDVRDSRGREDVRDSRGREDVRDSRGREDVRDSRGREEVRDPVRDPRGDSGRATERDRDARYGKDTRTPARDTRTPARDTRTPARDTRTPEKDTRVAAPSKDTRGGGLSKRERVEACKKQYGKKKKNKAAKKACIEAAKGK